MALFYYSVEHRKFKLPTEALRRRKPQIAKRLRDSEYIERLEIYSQVAWNVYPYRLCLFNNFEFQQKSVLDSKPYNAEKKYLFMG